MKIINDIFDTKEQFHNSYVAIGTFDGIHYGHQQLIEAAVEKAKEIKEYLLYLLLPITLWK